jgi:hypothetical protein
MSNGKPIRAVISGPIAILTLQLPDTETIDGICPFLRWISYYLEVID